jgi:hypothetical protein
MIHAIMEEGLKNVSATGILKNLAGFWINAWKTGSIFIPIKWIKSAAAGGAAP